MFAFSHCFLQLFKSCFFFFFHIFLLPFLFPVSDHSNLPEIVSKVLTQEMQKIFVNKNLESFNEEFLKHNATSIQHQLSGLFNFLMFSKMSWLQWFKSRKFFCINHKLEWARSLLYVSCFPLPSLTILNKQKTTKSFTL